MFLTIVLINKQEIHQGLIKGCYTTKDWGGRERRGGRERVFVSAVADEIVSACFLTANSDRHGMQLLLGAGCNN